MHAFIGIGTNQGDGPAHIAGAFAALATLPLSMLVRRSSVYLTAPHEAAGPDYLNAVVELQTGLEPLALLDELQRIEASHGRERPFHNAPRTLDLDLLLYGDVQVDTPRLSVPHPRLHERAFVLCPLVEIAASVNVPGRGAAAALLPAVGDQRVERLPVSTPPGVGRFRHIAVEGPIGVGKTSLARRLAAHLGAELLLERADDNPFLARFYADMPGYAFQTQLFFLFQRHKQVQAAAQPGMFSNALISDFLFAKDALFARLNLADEEYRLYAQMYAQLASQVRGPDLVIWLQASPATLLQRIHRRGIAMEQAIETAYLQRLCDAYVEHFHDDDGAPVLGIGTENFDPVDRDADFALLLERIAAFQGRRQFFDAHVEVTLT